MVYHSKLTQIFAYICAVIIICVLVAGAWSTIHLTLVYFGFISSKLHSNEWLLVILYVALLYCVRVSYLLFRFLKTLKGKLSYDSNGVDFELNEKRIQFRWEALAKSKNYADCQIFVLFNEKGEHVFSIWELASGYRGFKDAFHVNSGT